MLVDEEVVARDCRLYLRRRVFSAVAGVKVRRGKEGKVCRASAAFSDLRLAVLESHRQQCCKPVRITVADLVTLPTRPVLDDSATPLHRHRRRASSSRPLRFSTYTVFIRYPCISHSTVSFGSIQLVTINIVTPSSCGYYRGHLQQHTFPTPYTPRHCLAGRAPLTLPLLDPVPLALRNVRLRPLFGIGVSQDICGWKTLPAFEQQPPSQRFVAGLRAASVVLHSRAAVKHPVSASAPCTCA